MRTSYNTVTACSTGTTTRRRFLRATVGSVLAAPLLADSRVFGANSRINLASIGVGGRGRDDLRTALGFKEIQVVSVCDVVADHRQQARDIVKNKYGTKDCGTATDFREITARKDVDAVLVATPDHTHAIICIDAIRNGKDVFCEKPESLTIREGRVMVETARRFGRVLAGGSQRVWNDYQSFHSRIRAGAIGEVREAWVNVGGPSQPCDLPGVPKPRGVAWDLWLGPAPWRPYHPQLIRGGFRPFREYSGGGMTDWGCHTFGGALFACNLHKTGPVEITPPDGKDVKRLTYRFANGVRMYHGGGWHRMLSFKGTEGKLPDLKSKNRRAEPTIHIPNYKGRGGLFGDFVQCIQTREKPFRDIEVAHRTATHCHLGNIAYWLKRPLQWDPEKERFIGDPDADRWLDRPTREPWSLL